MGQRSWNTAQTVLHLFQLILLSHFITTIYFVCLRKIELHCAVGVHTWISLLFSSCYFYYDSQNSSFFQQLSHDLLCYKAAYGDFVIIRLHQCVKSCRWSPREFHKSHGYGAHLKIRSPRWHLKFSALTRTIAVAKAARRYNERACRIGIHVRLG